MLLKPGVIAEQSSQLSWLLLQVLVSRTVFEWVSARTRLFILQVPLVRALRQGVHPIVVLLNIWPLPSASLFWTESSAAFLLFRSITHYCQPLFAGLDVRPLKPPSPHPTPAPEGSRVSSLQSFSSVPFCWRSRSLSGVTGPKLPLLLSSSSSVHIHPPCLHQEPAPSQTLVGTLTINLRLRIPVIMITGIWKPPWSWILCIAM